MAPSASSVSHTNYSPKPTESLPQEALLPSRGIEPRDFDLPLLPSEPLSALSPSGKGARGVLSDCSQPCALPSPGSPSPRWCHAMCLSDLGTAVLIGGQGINQQSCEDALWKLEIGRNFRVVKGSGVSGTLLQLMHMGGGTWGFCT